VIKTVINSPLMVADAVVCNSESTRREITSVLLVLRKPVLVIYNGKDWTEYRCDRGSTVCTDGERRARLTVIGRISPRKGQDIAIHALAEIISKGYPASLTLVGNVFPGYEWYENELRQTIAELGVGDIVEFAGFRDDIRDVLNRTDIAIVPSRIEPFGTVAAECMAGGRLTIVADVQGLAEIVDNENTGLTFAADNPHALAQRCIWALAHPEDSARLALMGRQNVTERFSLTRYEEDVVGVIESASRKDRLRGFIDERDKIEPRKRRLAAHNL
jgi:glycosyltransferase involved in cell wall biosynthesis